MPGYESQIPGRGLADPNTHKLPTVQELSSRTLGGPSTAAAAPTTSQSQPITSQSQFDFAIKQVLRNRFDQANAGIRGIGDEATQGLLQLPEEVSAQPGFAGLRLNQARRLSGIEESGLTGLLTGAQQALSSRRGRLDDLANLASGAFSEQQAVKAAEAQAANDAVEMELSVLRTLSQIPENRSVEIGGVTYQGLKPLARGGGSGSGLATSSVKNFVDTRRARGMSDADIVSDTVLWAPGTSAKNVGFRNSVTNYVNQTTSERNITGFESLPSGVAGPGRPIYEPANFNPPSTKTDILTQLRILGGATPSVPSPSTGSNSQSDSQYKPTV